MYKRQEGIRDQNGHFLDDDSKYAKKDAFGHVLHSGTGNIFVATAKKLNYGVVDIDMVAGPSEVLVLSLIHI